MDGRPNRRNKAPFSNSSGLKSVFEKLRFCDGASGVEGRPNRKDKATFSDFSGVMWTGPRCGFTVYKSDCSCVVN